MLTTNTNIKTVTVNKLESNPELPKEVNEIEVNTRTSYRSYKKY